MLFLHHPYAVNHLAILVIRDLLQINVGGVDHLHAGVAIVCAAEGTPFFGVWIEPIGLLSAASRACDNVYWSFWVHIRLLFAPIVHLVTIDRPKPLICVLMCPQLQINSVVVK